MPLIACCILFLSGSIINRSTYLAVESVEFTQESVVLNKVSDDDVSHKLQVNVFPLLASNKAVEFWSEDKNIVTIDDNGTITSKGYGETYVYVRSAENPTKRAHCKVVVTSDKVRRVWAENPISTMYVGDTHALSIKYEPTDVSDVQFNISSSDENVVYASQSGELIAKAKGSAKITIQLASDPTIEFSFDVEVKVKVQQISTDISSVESGASQFAFPQIVVTPANANIEVEYISSDSSIATVDQSGNITFLRAGRVEVVAKVNGETTFKKSYQSTMGYYTDVMFLDNNKTQIDFEEYQNKTLQLEWTGLPQKANSQNISFASDNSQVILVEDNQLKVVGGGKATISLIAKTSDTTSIERKISIFVNRKADEIKTEFSTFQYTTQKQINLDFALIPADATEKIEYSVSDGEVAVVENNKLVFSQKTINNKYAKVTITASTPSKLIKSVTFAYIDSSIEQIDIDASNINFTMPQTGEEVFNFSLVTKKSVKDIQLSIKEGAECLSQYGYIFTLRNNGSAKINVYLDGEQTASKTVTITITREVEQINDIQIVAKWQNEETETFSGVTSIYSSSKTFELSYSLYPQNTTLTKANVKIVGDCAQIVDNIIEFSKAGKITLVITADGVSKQIEIESTLLHPDSTIKIESTIMIDKGQSACIYDYISISPKYADMKYINFQFEGDCIALDNDGNITALCGGESIIDVTISTASQNISKQIVVIVDEKILHVEEIKFKDGAFENNYVTAMGDGADGKEINLVTSYGAYVELDEDDQEPYEVEYSVRNAESRSRNAIAYIQNNCLYFNEPGRVVITFKIGDKEEHRTLESTMGYAKNVSFLENDSLTFEFEENSYNIPTNFYNVYPLDAYKTNIKLTSENTNVFDVENNKVTFVGGGKSCLCLTYSTSAEETDTIKKEVYIKNRAQAINFFDEGDQVAYMVKDMTKISQLVLDYQIVSDGTLSDYNIVYESSNIKVATINNGIVNFINSGETTIVVKVQEKSNNQDDFDAVGKLKIIVRNGYKIYKLKADSNLTIEYDDTTPYIIYPIADKPIIDFEYSLSSGDDVIFISNYGEITYGTYTNQLGGNAVIKVAEKDGEDVYKLNVFVHRKAQISLNIDEIYKGDENYDIYTSKSLFDISSVVTISSDDALVNKTIKYSSSDTLVAQVDGTFIQFVKAGSTTITIEVWYNGGIETNKSFTIYSSLNKVENFDVVSNVEPINGVYILYTSDVPIEFEIKNIKPKDYQAQVSKMFFASANSKSFTTSALSSTSFNLVPQKAGKGNFTFRFDSADSALYKYFDVEIKQWSTAVEVRHNNQKVDSLTTLENVIDLTAIVGPDDATIKTVLWEMVDNSIAQLSQTANNARITFNNIGTVVVTAMATDGKSSISISIEYKDLDEFRISTTQAAGTDENDLSMTFREYEDIQTAYLKWGQTSITFKISTLLDGKALAFSDFSNFKVSTGNNANAEINIDSAGNFTITTASIQDSPIYEDVITVSYSAVHKGSISIKIYRDGLQAIDFGDHNEVKDAECGLQQMRVYGNKSYYGGLKTYYTMDVNITNNNAVVLENNQNSTNFVNQIVWETTTNSGVTITDNNKGIGYVNIDFASVPSLYINSFDSIYNFDGTTTDNLAKITVYAKNRAGRILAQYSFILVDGVNIFDQDGYLNAGGNIVLQKSFGHTDQQSQIDSGKYVKLEAYVSKTTIYGNGHLMNFAYRNTFTSEKTYKDYENIQVAINNVVNLNIQGSNYDSTYSTYNIELTSVSKIAYCDLYYMYRSIEISSGTVSARKCIFRSFKSSGIIGSSDGTKSLYLEDIIMFDVGQRAIELQKNATAYIKGFLDVYNFQNKDDVQDILGTLGKIDVFGTASTTIMKLARDNNLIVEKQNKEWVNMVGISTKGTDLEIHYYNDDTGKYEYITDGDHDSAPGLIRISQDLTFVGITAWSYKAGHEYLTWENEYIVDDSGALKLNYEYLISTTSKISRLGKEINNIEQDEANQ